MKDINSKIIDNLTIVKKMINESLYSRDNNRLNDSQIIEMIMISAYLNIQIGSSDEDNSISEKEYNKILKMFKRIDELKNSIN